MALRKIKQVDNLGIEGDYWRITQSNTNYDRNDNVVVLQLYVSQAGRESGKNPLPETVTFNFVPDDHPITELDTDKIDPNLLDDLVDLEKHLRYLHIKTIAALAQAIPEKDRSHNEQSAIFFLDAEDVL